MGLAHWLRRDKEDDPAPPPKAIVAAAVPLAGPGVKRLAKLRGGIGEAAWQRDAWYFYDVVGELKAPLNRIALALSKAEPYAAQVDPDTGEPAGRSDDHRAQAAARMVLGGAKQRGQLLFNYGVIWQVCGDAYVVIQPDRAKGDGTATTDRWYILTADTLTERGGRWTFMDPLSLDQATLEQDVDRLIRVWSPHPKDQIQADSAVRSALPILAEIEKSSQNIAARLDSRLASNGLLFLPSEADFPQGDHDSVADAWSDYLTSLMEHRLSNPGTAGAQVPIVGVLPAEWIESIRHVDLATQFDQAVADLRAQDTERLAASLDMPKAIAQGTEAESNHWSAWQVDETTYKVFIEPLLQRLGDPLTEHWFRPVLAAMGVENPENLILAWDTTGIVAKPDQTTDVKWAWEKRLASDETMRTVLGLTDDDAPDQNEARRRALYDLVAVAPTLLADPSVADALDLGIQIAPVAAGVAAGNVEGGRELEQGSDVPAPRSGAEERSMPQTQDDVPEGLVAAAEVIVRQSLARAGARLLTRENRGQFGAVPKGELYQHIRPSEPAALVQVEYAAPVAEAFGRSPVALDGALHRYVHGLLDSGEAHDPERLREALRAAR